MQDGVTVLHAPVAAATDELTAMKERGTDGHPPFTIACQRLLIGDTQARV